MSDIGIPLWAVLFMPYLASPGWALLSFAVVGGLVYRASRGRKRRWLLALVAAFAAGSSLPLAGLALLDSDTGAPAIACVVLVAFAIGGVVLYLRSGSPSQPPPV